MTHIDARVCSGFLEVPMQGYWHTPKRSWLDTPAGDSGTTRDIIKAISIVYDAAIRDLLKDMVIKYLWRPVWVCSAHCSCFYTCRWCPWSPRLVRFLITLQQQSPINNGWRFVCLFGRVTKITAVNDWCHHLVRWLRRLCVHRRETSTAKTNQWLMLHRSLKILIKNYHWGN